MDRRIIETDLSTMLSALADVALPRACVVCGRPLLPQERDICMECLADLPRTFFEGQRANPMADRFNSLVEETRGDGPAGAYSCCAALFYYIGECGYDRITKSLKYGRNFAAGQHFAAMFGHVLAASPLYADVDCVVPVPLHWTRRLSRGYNQAEVIARAMCAAWGAEGRPEPPVVPMLCRTRRTRSQVRLETSSKADNVHGAFAVDMRRMPRQTPSHVLMVDDVFTTGATLCACHAALRQALGPGVRISAATLAFAGHQ